MVVMMVPQKKNAEAGSQRVVKLVERLLTSRPASTAETTLCRGAVHFNSHDSDVVFAFQVRSFIFPSLLTPMAISE